MKPHLFQWMLTGTLLVAASLPLRGQSDGKATINDGERKISRIALGTPIGATGATVSVPIVFAPAEGALIQQLRLTVKYRSAYLAFERLDAPASPNGSRYKLELEKKDTAGEGITELTTLIIKATSTDQPKKPGVPPGKLASLIFQISERSDHRTVNLVPAVEATEVDSGRRLTANELEALEGSVRVQEKTAPTEFVGSCFFFAH